MDLAEHKRERDRLFALMSRPLRRTEAQVRSLAEFREAQEQLAAVLGESPSDRDLAIMEAGMDAGRLWHEATIHAPKLAVLEAPEREQQVRVGRRPQKAAQRLTSKRQSNATNKQAKFLQHYHDLRQGGVGHNGAVLRAGKMAGVSARQAKRYAKASGLTAKKIAK